MHNQRVYTFRVNHQDIILEGQIVYNSKDYHVALTHPFSARNAGSHLMYSIPARFTTPIDRDRDQRKDGVIRLEDRAPKELIELYETYKDIPFDSYAQTLLLPHKDTLKNQLSSHLNAILEARETKRKNRQKLKSGEIDNKEHSKLAKESKKQISQLSSTYRNEAHSIIKALNIPPLGIHMSQALELIEQWHTEDVSSQ